VKRLERQIEAHSLREKELMADLQTAKQLSVMVCQKMKQDMCQVRDEWQELLL
jgi:hypothetical protein